MSKSIQSIVNMQYMKNNEWRRIISFSLPYLKGYWSKFFYLFSLIVLGAIIASIEPIIWGNIIDCLTVVRFHNLIQLLILFLGIQLFTFALGLLESYLGAKLDYEIESGIRRTVFDKALKIQCAELDQFDTGELVSRVTSDSGAIISFVIDFFTSIITILINIFAALFFALRISPQLSAISIAFIPMSIAVNLFFKSRFRVLSEQQKKYGDHLSSFLVNALGHIPAGKAYHVEEKQNRRYASIIKDGWSVQKDQIILNSKSSAVSMCLSCLATFATISFSGLLILRGIITVGNMVSFQTYISKLSSAVSKLLQMNYSAQSTSVAVDRIISFLSMPEDSSALNESCERINVSSIEFSSVTFAYKDHDATLRGIGFLLQAPGLYAFVGENGCGKSTVLKLIMKYYSPNSGDIRIDGKSISEFSAGSIRHNICYYAKDVYIINDTLLANLLLGSDYDPDVVHVAPQSLIDACNKAGLSEFIDQLPLRYDTRVGEDGKLLSSGQMQRIAIVRAMLSKASVLLFDEITSDLDGSAECEIMDILNELSRTHLVVSISHRINAVINAQKIMLIEDGMISAQGTHEELMQNSATYQSLFSQQQDAYTGAH